MINLLKIVQLPWDQARGYLRLDLQTIESSINQRWGATFGNNNLLVPGAGGTGVSTVFTLGSVLFAGVGGLYSQNNPKLFWDNTNFRLGIGTSSPLNTLDVRGVISIGANPAQIGALRLQNSDIIYARNGANTSNKQMMYLDGSNNLIMGEGGVDLLPASDNAENLGSLAQAKRWQSIQIGTATSSIAGKLGIGNTVPGVLLDLGLAGTTAGIVRLAGLTSGNVTMQPASAAGTWTLVLPITGGTNKYALTTDGTGISSWTQIDLTLAVTGILPLANGGTGANLNATGGVNQLLKQSSVGGVVTVGTIASANLSDGTNIALLNAANLFTAVNTFTKAAAGDVVLFTNAGATPKTGYLYSDASLIGLMSGAGATGQGMLASTTGVNLYVGGSAVITNTATLTTVIGAGTITGFSQHPGGLSTDVTNPGATNFRVAGTSTLNGNVTTNGDILTINSPAARGSGDAYLQFKDPTGIKGYLGYVGADDTYYVWNALNTDMRFYTNNLRRGTAFSTGGFSWGDTTDPGNTNFRVAGTSTLVGLVTTLSDILTVKTPTARGSGDAYLQFSDPTGVKGYLGYVGADDTYYIWNGLNADVRFYANNARKGTMFASGGFSWGDTTDPGATNFRVAGTSTFVGAMTATGAITAGNKITTYNNIATVSNGVPSILATIDLTNQGTAIGGNIIYTIPASGAGRYRISFVAKVTTAAGVSSTLGGVAGFQVGYTDADDSVSTTTPTETFDSDATTLALNTTQAYYAGVIIVNAKASTNITYNMGYTSAPAGGMLYNLHIILEAL